MPEDGADGLEPEPEEELHAETARNRPAAKTAAVAVPRRVVKAMMTSRCCGGRRLSGAHRHIRKTWPFVSKGAEPGCTRLRRRTDRGNRSVEAVLLQREAAAHHVLGERLRGVPEHLP